MGLMQRRIKGVYLDPQSLPFVSSWFVLMWEPNPAKADYTCIKFLKIAVFLIPHLQWKCNGSSLQNINLPKLRLCRNKGVETCEPNEACVWCFWKDIVTLMMFLGEKSKKKSSPIHEVEKNSERLQRLLTWAVSMCVCVRVCNRLCTVTQIVALKNKKVFRLYLSYFTKSI